MSEKQTTPEQDYDYKSFSAMLLKGYGEEEKSFVSKIADGMGYGRLMALTSLLWQQKEFGCGAFSVGPCVAFTAPCDHPVKDDNGHCEVCCGAGWVTKYVKEKVK